MSKADKDKLAAGAKEIRDAERERDKTRRSQRQS
jgi:hypothetical protein